MTFSEKKSDLIRDKKSMAAATFFIALISAAAVFLPYVIKDGGYFFYFGDFNVQQIPFYKLCHDAVRSGQFGWSWTTDLGSDLISSYSFYLMGSPFFWLTIPFPSEAVPFLMAPLLVLKFALAALTAYFYIRRFTRTPQAACLGGLLYAFSGFSVYNVFFNHFHEAIIIFPLLLLSLELLITENKRGAFAVTVAAAAIINYFFFFGMAVFCIIYWIVRLVSGAYKFRFSRFLAILFEAVVGVLISAFILLPSAYQVFGNTRVTELLDGWTALLYGKEQIYGNIIECFFFPPDLPARPVFFPYADVKWSSLGGWLPVFSMAGVFAYCSAHKGSWIKRIICVSVFFAMIPILNSTFSMLNDAYYARWFYMPILIMCLATVSAAEDKNVSFKGGYITTVFITLFIALTVGLMPQKTDDGIIFGIYSYAGKNIEYTGAFWLITGIAVVSLIVLLCALVIRKSSMKVFFKMALVAVIVVSVGYSSAHIGFGKSNTNDVETVIKPRLAEAKLDLEGDNKNFRTDYFECLDNVGMYLGYPSINAFHSVVSGSIMEYYDFIGVKRDVASRPATEWWYIRPFLSVKYLMAEKGSEGFISTEGKTLMPGYIYKFSTDAYDVYENDYYIPYGFSYNRYIKRSDLYENFTPKERGAIMLKALVLEDEDAEKYSAGLENLMDIVNYEITDETDYDPSTELFCDEETLRKDILALKETAAYDFESDSRHFSATVKRNGNSLVFFSVPYSDGWTAYVNGEKTEIIKTNAGFMSVAVEDGESNIEFRYRTPGLFAGMFVSIVGIAALLIYLLIFNFYKNKNKVWKDYKEGDALIKKWCKDEAEEIMKEEDLNCAENKDIPDGVDEISGYFKKLDK